MTRRRLPFVLLVLLLLAGTLLATRASLAHERGDARRQGEARAERAASVIRLGLTEATSALENTAGLIDASYDVTPAEFATYGRRTLGPSGLGAIRWVERVPASRRAAYERATGHPIVELVESGLRPAGARPVLYPVTRSVTVPGTATVSGLDLATDPARRAAMEAAAATGRPAMTMPVALPGAGARGAVIVQPVYRGGGTPAPGARERSLRGFVLGALRLDALIRAARAAVDPDLAIEIRDRGTLLSAASPAAEGGPAATIPVAGRRWTVAIAAPRPSATLPLLILIGGLALTGAAIALTVTAGRRNRFAREAVARATEQLRASRESQRALVENSPDVVTRFDSGLRCLYANAAIERVTGRPPSYFVGRNMDEAGATDEMVETLAAAVLSVFATGEPAVADFEVIGPEGLTAMQARLAPEPAPEGGVESVLVVSRDVTGERTAEAALRSSEERYRSLVAALSDGVVVQTATGAIIASNPAAERILGLTADQLMGRVSFDPRWRAIRDDGSPFPGEEHPAMVTLRTGIAQREVTMGVHKPDGTLTWITVSTEPVEGDPPAVVCCFTEITARRQAEREQAALRRIATLIAADASSEIVFGRVAEEAAALVGADAASVLRFEDGPSRATLAGAWAADGVRLPGEGTQLVLGPGSASGRVAATGLPARGAGRGEATGADGVARDLEPGSGADLSVSTPILVDGVVWGALAAATTGVTPLPPDVEDRLAQLAELAALSIKSETARDQLTTLAATDHLTGLWNRRAFQDRLAAEIERARRYDRPMSLVVMDIDHFKRVNDVHGHPAGDRVLIEVARRLFATVREGEIVARVGGEEFAWILPETDGEGAIGAAERVRRAISAEPFPDVGPLTVSLGVCDLDEGETAVELVRLADTALYRSKRDGRDRVTRYAPGALLPGVPSG